MDDDRDEKGQSQQKSSSNATDIYRNALRLRRGLQKNPSLRQATKTSKGLAKKAGSKIAKRVATRVALFLATNPEILIPLIIIFIIVIVLILILLPANTQNVNADAVDCTTVAGASCQDTASLCPIGSDGTQTIADTSGSYTCSNSATGTAQVCCLPQRTYQVPDCATIDQRLQSDFGVIIKQVGETVSCSKRQEIYRIYSIPFQSASYRKYLKPTTPFTLQFNAPDTSGCSSHAYTKSAYLILFYGLSRYLDCGPERNAGFYILHETGHVIGARNYTLFSQQFPYKSLTQSNPSCFVSCAYGPQPKTYSLCWNNEPHETFAEFNSLYIYNYKSGIKGTISNFRSQCTTAWNYYYNTLYGGTIISP